MKKGLLLVIIIAFFSCKTEKSSNVETFKKPNIVFVLVDDLGYADVGFNGSKYFQTPNLDALAKESLVLDNAYMYPTCSPSRTAIFTGKQSFRTGVYTVPVLEKGTAEENIFSRWTVGKEHPIYAEPLAEAGYKSIHIGKYHIVGPYPEKELAMPFPFQQKLTQPEPGDYSWVETHKKPEIAQYYPEGRGFIKNVGGTFRGDPGFEEGGYKSVAGGYWAPFSNPFIREKANDDWLTDRLTDEAIDFMKSHKTEPFLINLNYYAVHRAIRSRSDALYEKYKNKPVDSVLGQGIGRNAKLRDLAIKYATMVESVDDNIKRVLDFLDESGLRENTIIIFTSDNGYHRMASANKQLRGAKGDIYEGGIKVPMLVNWPEKVTPRRSDVAVTALDIFPTLMDLSKTEDYDSSELDGASIIPLFKSDDKSLNERPLFWHLASRYKHGTCSVIRKGDYKLIQFLTDGKLELYNLKNDASESKNLSEMELGKSKVLLSELVAWRKANNVPLPPNSVLEF
ncbi:MULTISPECIES: sulfatase [Lacinutrix]|uniref:sulfatase n=1 Tax=Lacinutrix TaxID=291183 RepID=UPI0006E27BAA|nr:MULTISPECIES: sulfatase [Lacinutrix]QRM89492.1 sulfatase-like hydrolase/transferase [Lacinutrix sp. WUR7]